MQNSLLKDDGQVQEALMPPQMQHSRKKPRGGRRGFSFDASNLGKLAGPTRTGLKRSKPIRGADASVTGATGPNKGRSKVHLKSRSPPAIDVNCHHRFAAEAFSRHESHQGDERWVCKPIPLPAGGRRARRFAACVSDDSTALREPYVEP